MYVALLLASLCLISAVIGQQTSDVTLSVQLDLDINPGGKIGPLVICPPKYGTGNCPNSCAQKNLQCCHCAALCPSQVYGATQTCTCCPKTHTCCSNYFNPPVFGVVSKCCPPGTSCTKNGCQTNKKPPASVIPTPATIECSTCPNKFYEVEPPK
jgi:hypothetical protein